MKKIVTYLLLLFLALMVCIGGAGTSYVAYCCDGCQEAAIGVVRAESCCSSSKQGQKHTCAERKEKCPFLSAACDKDASDTCCEVQQIQFDWSQTIIPAFDLQPLSIELFMFDPISFFSSLKRMAVLWDGEWMPPIPASSPRIYLSFLTTLLI